MTDRITPPIALCALLLPLLAGAAPVPAPVADEEIAPAMEVVSDLVEQTSRELNVSRDQARRGLGALFSHARAHLSETEFQEIARAVHDMDELLAAAPTAANATEPKSEPGLFGSRESSAVRLDASLQAAGFPERSLQPLLESTVRHLEGSSPIAAALLRQVATSQE